MLGFSAYSETPYSQAVTSVEANAFLTGGVPSTGALGTLTFIQVANKSIASIAASSTANAFFDVEGESNPNLTGVSATHSISTFASITGKAANTLSSGTATGSTGSVTAKGGGGVGVNSLGVSLFSLGTIQQTGKAQTTLPNVLGDISVGALQGPAIEEDLVSASVTGSVGTISTKANANSTITGTSSTATNNRVNVSVVIAKTIASVVGTLSLGLEASAKASTRILSSSSSIDTTNISTTAAQRAYSNTDYTQAHVTVMRRKRTNKIVYVRTRNGT